MYYCTYGQCKKVDVGTAIMLAAAHERRQAPPYGRVDINITVYDDHFSL